MNKCLETDSESSATARLDSHRPFQSKTAPFERHKATEQKRVTK